MAKATKATNESIAEFLESLADEFRTKSIQHLEMSTSHGFLEHYGIGENLMCHTPTGKTRLVLQYQLGDEIARPPVGHIVSGEHSPWKYPVDA